jgi:SAM-dependent methyltransferase
MTAQASFRDPGGTVIQHDGRILRVVYTHAAAGLNAFLKTSAAREAMDAGKLIRSVRISPSELPGIETDYLMEHERVPFASYPYEWAPEMLHAAGELTIYLAQSALKEGFGIKDATPYNVLFRGSDPVFVDVLSFEPRDPKDATWIAYGQFARTFLLPLLASKHFGMPIDHTYRDGFEPEMVYRWAGPLQRLRSPFLSLVSIPKWLGGREANYHQAPASSPEKARFVMERILKSCARNLERVRSVQSDSAWSGYLDHKSLYSPEQFAQKERFVAEALQIARPHEVLDVGANEGHFSFLAASQGASVVAIDTDPAVVGRIWRRAGREQADVLPLVIDLTRPTPAMGWRNRECASFLDRASGRFDMVMMLAVLHHVLVTERIPIDEVLALVEELTREYVLIEFVTAEDAMFRKIVRGRDGLYSHVTKAWFEAAAAQRFELVRTTRIDGLHRWLYLFRRRRATK